MALVSPFSPQPQRLGAMLGAAAPGLQQPGMPPGAPGAPQQPGMGMLTGANALAPTPLPLPNTDYVGDRPSFSEEEDGEPVDVIELRKQYTDYVVIKQQEILEGRTAYQYYHGDQFTEEQLRQYARRHQPAIVFNRVSRKINGLIGVVDKLRGDAKAVGRVENNEHGAEVATQCVRYAIDQCDWKTHEIEVLQKAALSGIAVAEFSLVQGDKKDLDIKIGQVDVTTFFYDPRSVKLDFSDCRYMGVSKLMTQDEFEEMFPGGDAWAEAMGTIDDTGITIYDQDKYFLWSQGRTRLRLVEHWYRSKGEWKFAFYAGTKVLKAGISPYRDEKGRTMCRYEAFAVNIDNLGVHYGFVRNLQGPQDAVNQHRSKALHIMNTRQLIINRQSLGGDNPTVDELRREGARPDGVILWDGPPELAPKFEGLDQQFLQQTQYYQDAKQEIDTFGPNPALAPNAGGPTDISGRSLAMQQQAGLAELGTFLSQWRGWRHRIHKKTWALQQTFWTDERILRVTNDEGVAQYLGINQMRMDPWGRPMLVNAIGQLDVDIIMDEAPPHANVMADSFDLLQSLAQGGEPVPPPILIQASSLPSSEKKKLISMYQQAQQPDPQQMMMKQAAQQGAIDELHAKATKTLAEAKSSEAGAIHKLAMAHHEVQKAHGTQTGTAIDTMQALQPPPIAGAPGGQAPQGGQGGSGPPMQGGGGQGGPQRGARGSGPPQANGAALAQLAALQQAGRGQQGGLPQQPQIPPPSGPPYGGAQLINGQLYLPDPSNPGKWAMVVSPDVGGQGGQQPQQPQAQRPMPGGPPVRAPDGNMYVHAPHAGGLYQRVLQ